jgi:DNA-binding NtrC family response regulator
MKIMILEDDLVIASVLEKFLQAEKHDCIISINPFEALENFKHEAFDVIISDQFMKQMNGLEVIEQIKIQYPKVYSILMTGSNDSRIEQKAIAIGVNALFIKPFDYELFLNTISMFEKEIELNRHR